MRRTLKAHSSSRHVGVFESRTSVEENYTIGFFQESVSQQLVVCGGYAGPFRRKEDSFVTRPIQNRLEDFLVGDCKRNSARCAEDLEEDIVSIGLWDAQSRGEGRRILPSLAG